jgi:hypothetical protein
MTTVSAAATPPAFPFQPPNPPASVPQSYIRHYNGIGRISLGRSDRLVAVLMPSAPSRRCITTF